MTNSEGGRAESGQAAHGRVWRVAEEPAEALEAACRAVAAGQCIVLPTDTVYGIGADPFNPAAVRGLLAAKGRGRQMPPPVLIGQAAELTALVDDPPGVALRLAERYWPGALTLILPARADLGMDLGETHQTIAVRVPAHEFTRELLARTGPLAVSSANLTAHPAATTVAQAVEMLTDRVAVYLDAGPSAGGQASTIVEFVSHPGGRVLRAGAIDWHELLSLSPLLTGPGDQPDAEGGPGGA